MSHGLTWHFQLNVANTKQYAHLNKHDPLKTKKEEKQQDTN